jgi:hypothetical protein
LRLAGNLRDVVWISWFLLGSACVQLRCSLPILQVVCGLGGCWRVCVRAVLARVRFGLAF